jgi:hypothetical protein
MVLVCTWPLMDSPAAYGVRSTGAVNLGAHLGAYSVLRSHTFRRGGVCDDGHLSAVKKHGSVTSASYRGE